jgi:hypothetical protein
MALLFRLPLMLFELLLRRLFGHDQEDRFGPAAATAPPPPPPAAAAPVAPAFTGASGNGAPPPSAEEAIARRVAREAAAAAVASPSAVPDDELPPPTPLRPIGEGGHLAVADEVVESFGPADDVGDVGGTITVEEPWAGYASQPASAIVARLRKADPATKAVVALYERGHKKRATVLKATG